jgi:protein TonB
MRYWSREAARDRLSSTLFIAALLHGVLILGVTFRADAPTRIRPRATSLEVVLVTRDYRRLPSPQDAPLLAQQNLIGHGNAAFGTAVRTAVASPLPVPDLGPDQPGAGFAPRPNGTPLPARMELTTNAPASRSVLRDRSGALEQAMMRSQLPPGDVAPVEVLAQPDKVNVLPDRHPRELLVSASTQESRVASYLNSWKSKVERIGTLNFPYAEELQRSRVHPVLEVAITASGDLREIVIRSSSGRKRLDQAAISILRAAAPFEPFPKALRDQYDVMRFAYEWRFTGGIATGRVTTIAAASGT